MKKTLSVFAAALVIGGVAAGASAQTGATDQATTARLSGAAGQVTVDRGEGFVQTDASTILRSGDVVRTSSATQVVFADGCSLPLAAGAAFTIPVVSPCAAGVGAGAATTTASAGGLIPVSATGLAVGGLAAGGLVAVVAIAADDDDDAPISR